MNDKGAIGVERPTLDEFDLSDLPEPADGVLYLYRSDNDGFWYVEIDADIALQEATGYPVGELREYEGDEDWDPHEDCELLAIHLPWSDKLAHEEIPTPIETEGSAPDYCVLYGDEPARRVDAGGAYGEGYVDVEADEGRVEISISYDIFHGLKGVRAMDLDEPEDVTHYEPAKDQPDQGTRWLADVPEDLPDVKIVPETEVDRGAE